MEYINAAQRKRVLSAGFDTAIDVAWPIIFEHAGEVQGKLDRVYWVGSFSDEDALKFALGSADDPYAKHSPILGYFSIDETMGCVEKRLKTDDWDKLYTKIDRWYFNSIIKSWNKFAANKKLNTKQISCYGSNSLEKLDTRSVKLLCGPKRNFPKSIEAEIKKFCFDLCINPELTFVLKNKVVHEINFADTMDWPTIDEGFIEHVQELCDLLGNTDSVTTVFLPKEINIDRSVLKKINELIPSAKIRRLSDDQEAKLSSKIAFEYRSGKREFSFDSNDDKDAPVSPKKTVKKKTIKKKVVKKKKATWKKK